MVSTMPTPYLVLSCARYDTRVATITCVCVCGKVYVREGRVGRVGRVGRIP